MTIEDHLRHIRGNSVRADRIRALFASAAAAELGHEHLLVFDSDVDEPPVVPERSGDRQQLDRTS